MMRLKITILAVFLSSCVSYTPPNSWTLRDDCHLRASQRNEDFTIDEWIAKVNKEEGKTFGIVLSPAGAASVTNEIKQCHIDLEACQSK